jgi:hypothetical protein
VVGWSEWMQNGNNVIEMLLIMYARSTQATAMPESPENMPHDIPVLLNVFPCSYKEKRVAVNGNGILVKLDVTQDPKFAVKTTKHVRVAHGL